MIRRETTYLVVITCIFLLVSSSTPIYADVVWSDDFEDGDLNGWEVYGILYDNDDNEWGEWEGNASVIDGAVTIGGPVIMDEPVGEGKPPMNFTIIQKEISQDYGTWSFDYLAGKENQWFSNLFISDIPLDELWIQDGSVIDPVAQTREGIWMQWHTSQLNSEENDYVSFNLIHQDVNNYFRLMAIDPPRQSSTTWLHFEISRTENYTYGLKIDNGVDTLVDFVSGQIRLDFKSLKYLQIMSCSQVKLDNFAVADFSQSSVDTTDANELFVVAGLTIAAVFTAFIGFRSKKKLALYLKKRRIRKTQSLLQTFSDIFTDQQLSYLAVLGQSKFDDKELSQKLSKEVPPEFKDYKFLMNPIRLSIIKLLYKNFNLSSTVIKTSLNISWGDYKTHINALLSKGFISVHDEFHDGLSTKVVYLEEPGRLEYESVLRLLKEFLQDADFGFFETTTTLYPDHIDTKP